MINETLKSEVERIRRVGGAMNARDQALLDLYLDEVEKDFPRSRERRAQRPVLRLRV